MVNVSAAPGRLELVRAFVNTRNIEFGSDAIDTTDRLARWLVEAQLLDGEPVVEPRHVREAAAVREAIRGALAANHERADAPARSLAVLNDAAGRALLTISFSEAGWTPVPQTGGVDGAIGSLLGIIVRSMADGTWSRLKACTNDACQWAFYDTSRARTGKWCSMGICGNRAKQQAWRERKQVTSA